MISATGLKNSAIPLMGMSYIMALCGTGAQLEEEKDC